MRRGHLGEIAEAADDGVEIGEFGFQRGGGFAENFLKLLGAKLAGALEIFDGDLQREKRVAQFVSQAAGEFAPGGDAFGLHKLFFLRGEGAGHVVESAGKLADFVAALHIDVGVPAAGGDVARAIGKLFDGASDAAGNPPADQQADEDGGESDEAGGFQNLALKENEFLGGTAEQENAEQFVVAAA